MSILTTFIEGLIPKERTRRLRKVPIIIKLYSGGTCVVEHRVKAPTIINRTTCIVGPPGGSISISHPSFDGKWDITKITASLDMPTLRNFDIPLGIPPMKCPNKGELMVQPQHPGLLQFSRGGWG